ncbi:MAG TPA: DUF3667 domain-containing protein [Steroidobacteraceae bacterium]|jgi:hypothetical protein|nr:DUF3667 domain-containing protein [Steroidobacteraceae bacterium]
MNTAPRASLAPAVPPAPATEPQQRCENCGNEVSQRYCGACGQRLDAPVHSLWHFSQIATEDLTHADSRVWRTLWALLAKPGLLTCEFLGGRRARYLPPVRLYLVLSVIFFLVASAVSKPFTVLALDDGHPAKVLPADNTVKQGGPLAAPLPGETPEQRAERVCAQGMYQGPFASVLKRFQSGCRKMVLGNGSELQTQFLHNIPRAMFLFLPLLAGIMMLMYWRPRHYYVEHLLLFLHNHALVFLVATLALLLSGLTARVPVLKFAIFVYFVWYMYRSMRVVYQQGRALTLSKLAVLSFFYLMFAALMLAATSLYSVLML